jgi:two-component system sensor histidine kinase RegB
MVWHQPVSTGDSTTDLAQLHLVGMWVAFAITAAILLMVLGTLSRRLRQKQQQLSSIRETRLRDEQIIALGLSAAAVAHRLGTPLNTMTLLVDEMKSVMPEGEQVADDLALMENQLTLCKEHLQQLSEAATHARTTRPEVLAAGQWLRRIRESATLLWPGANLEWQEPFPECQVAVDATLDQAILNLLANAISVSPDWVSVGAQHGSTDQLEIIVEDHGDGLDSSLTSTLGEHVVTSENGLGVGLFLSNATIQRLGGVLKARVSSEGTTMMIELPVASVEQPG